MSFCVNSFTEEKCIQIAHIINTRSMSCEAGCNDIDPLGVCRYRPNHYALMVNVNCDKAREHNDKLGMCLCDAKSGEEHWEADGKLWVGGRLEICVFNHLIEAYRGGGEPDRKLNPDECETLCTLQCVAALGLEYAERTLSECQACCAAMCQGEEPTFNEALGFGNDCASYINI